MWCLSEAGDTRLRCMQDTSIDKYIEAQWVHVDDRQKA